MGKNIESMNKKTRPVHNVNTRKNFSKISLLVDKTYRTGNVLDYDWERREDFLSCFFLKEKKSVASGTKKLKITEFLEGAEYFYIYTVITNYRCRHLTKTYATFDKTKVSRLNLTTVPEQVRALLQLRGGEMRLYGFRKGTKVEQ